MRPFVITAILTFLIVGSGCATVPRDAGFKDVEQTVLERTGRKVHWNQGSDSDKAVASEVRSLLGAELTADEAVQIALLNNRSLQATYESLSIAQADLVSAGLLRNPIFEAEVRFPEGGGGPGLELALVQDFIDLLYIPLRKRLAGAAFEAAKLRVAGSVLDLSGQVRAAFYTLQASEQTLEMRRQVLSATEASYDLAKRLRAAGNITELDLSNERALFEQSKLDVRTAELDALRRRERLNVSMGLWGEDTKWTVASRLPEIPAEEPEPSGFERLALERSLDLGIAKREIKQAAQSLGIARPLGLFGEVEAGVSAEREPEGDWALGPVLSFPIPLFNQGQPGVAAAQAELRGAGERYAATAVTIRSQVRTAHATVLAAREQANYYAKVILPLRARILEQTQLQYNAMQVGAFQLLQAKTEQVEAANSYIRSLRDYWVARTELEQLLSGRMTSFETTETETPSSPGRASGGGH